MIRKALTLLVSLLFLTAMASAGFYVVKDDGERVKVTPGNASQAQPENSSQPKKERSGFLSRAGGIMDGVLDMGGFSLTGLPAPDSPTDAATKRYVDKKSVNANGSSNSSSYGVPSLGEVLAEGNVANSPISFLKGVALGSGSYAVDGSVAIGEQSSSLKENSVALGANSTVNNSDTLKVGSDDEEMDVNVTGDLSVQGDISGEGKDIWSYDVAVGVNRTEFSVPEPLVNKSYHVSVTPVGSLAKVGVFNRTNESFGLKASSSTNATVLVTQ